MGFDVEFPDDFLGDLLNTTFDEACEGALNEVAPILEKCVKDETKKVIDHPGESELVESFKAGKPKKSKNGAWIVNVTPKGYSKDKMFIAKDGMGNKSKRKYPVSNALKAIWKEYGIPNQQPARPFLGRATRSAEHEVIQKIQENYSKKVGADT